jgi:hypothetical protein
MEKEMSPQESLSLISSMIEKTRHTFSDSSQYFLLWGYAVFLASVAQYIMISVNYEKSYMAWWIIIPALAVHFVLVARESKREKVSTYISEANGYLWMGIGFCFAVLSLVFAKVGWQYCFPFYVLFYALGTFVSGSLIRFKPLIIGGIISFVIAAGISFFDYKTQILLASVSILVSYIIPGHLLRAKYKHQNVLSHE